MKNLTLIGTTKHIALRCLSTIEETCKNLLVTRLNSVIDSSFATADFFIEFNRYKDSLKCNTPLVISTGDCHLFNERQISN